MSGRLNRFARRSGRVRRGSILLEALVAVALLAGVVVLVSGAMNDTARRAGAPRSARAQGALAERVVSALAEPDASALPDTLTRYDLDSVHVEVSTPTATLQRLVVRQIVLRDVHSEAKRRDADPASAVGTADTILVALTPAITGISGTGAGRNVGWNLNDLRQ